MHYNNIKIRDTFVNKHILLSLFPPPFLHSSLFSFFSPVSLKPKFHRRKNVEKNPGGKGKKQKGKKKGKERKRKRKEIKGKKQKGKKKRGKKRNRKENGKGKKQKERKTRLQAG